MVRMVVDPAPPPLLKESCVRCCRRCRPSWRRVGDRQHPCRHAAGSWTGEHVKHVRADGRAAVLTGVSDAGEHQLTTWLQQALAASDRLDDLARTFLRVGGVALSEVYMTWRQHVGPAAPAEHFLQILALGTSGDHFECAELWATESTSGLSMDGTLHTATDDVHVFIAGAIDNELEGHTTRGRLARVAADAQRRDTTIPDIPKLNEAWDSSQLEQHLRDVVESALLREASGNRVVLPQGWPPTVPTIAGPVHSVRI